jgi:hypothetical protein
MGATGDFFRARDEFRRHPFISNNFRRATPGLGIALTAFGVYLFAEGMYERLYKPKQQSAVGHGEHAHH